MRSNSGEARLALVWQDQRGFDAALKRWISNASWFRNNGSRRGYCSEKHLC